MPSELNRTDSMYLQRLAQSSVSFTHAPNVTGKGTKLVRSTVSQSLQKHYHRLAIGGYCAEVVTGNQRGEPPETTVTYSLTALGRAELGIHAPLMPAVHRQPSLTDAQLLAEADA